MTNVPPLSAFRDDGPIARALGGAGAAIPYPPIAVLLAGALPLIAALIAENDQASHGLVAATVAWLVVLGGLSSGGRPRERLRWSVPPALRAAEFAALLWIAAVAGEEALPAAFALCAAVAFRQYDVVYRLRLRHVEPPRWVANAALGWDGRLLLAVVLLVTDLLPAGFYVAAGLLAALLVGESVTSWRRFTRTGATQTYETQEDAE